MPGRDLPERGAEIRVGALRRTGGRAGERPRRPLRRSDAGRGRGRAVGTGDDGGVRRAAGRRRLRLRRSDGAPLRGGAAGPRRGLRHPGGGAARLRLRGGDRRRDRPDGERAPSHRPPRSSGKGARSGAGFSTGAGIVTGPGIGPARSSDERSTPPLRSCPGSVLFAAPRPTCGRDARASGRGATLRFVPSGGGADQRRSGRPASSSVQPFTRFGSQSTIPGKARKRPTVATSARKKGRIPRNTSASGMSGRTAATT